jgi:hypothetical protein
MTCDRSVVFSGYSVSSTNKTDRHDITEILLKVTLSAIKQSNNLPWCGSAIIVSMLGDKWDRMFVCLLFYFFYFCHGKEIISSIKRGVPKDRKQKTFLKIESNRCQHDRVSVF